MAGGCYLVGDVAVATGGAGIGGIALFGTAGGGDLGGIAVARCGNALHLLVSAVGAGLGDAAIRGTGGVHRDGLVAVAGGCYLVGGVAVATEGTGIGGVALFGTAGSGDLGGIAVPRCRNALHLLVSTVGAGCGDAAVGGTGGVHRDSLVAVAGGCYLVTDIAMATGGTGIGGVALFGTAGGSDLGGIAVGTALGHLQVGVITVEGITPVTDVVKDQIPSVEPVGGSVRVADAAVEIVHGTQLHPVYTQIDHVAAVGGRLVGQGVNMADAAVDAVVRDVDAAVGMLGAVEGAQEKQVVAVAEQEGGIGISAALGTGEQEGAAAVGSALPLDAPVSVMAQHHGLGEPEAGGSMGGAADGAVVDVRGVLGVTGAGDGNKVVPGGLPTENIFHILRFSVSPDLQIIQLHLVDGVAKGALVAEGKVLAADPVVGDILLLGANEIIVHGSQLSAVYAEIDHVGAIGGDLIGQPVHMLCGAVNAVVREPDAVVIVLGAGIVAQGDILALLIAEQVGLVGNVAGLAPGQQHGTAAEGTGGFPLHHPGNVMLQHHGAAHVVNAHVHFVVGNAAVDLDGIVEGVAPVHAADPLIVHRLPAIVCRGKGAHGRVVNIAHEEAAGIVIGVRRGLAAVGAEIELAVGVADRHVLDLKKA